MPSCPAWLKTALTLEGGSAACMKRERIVGREMKAERAAKSLDLSAASAIRAANAHLEMTIRAMRDRLEHQKAEADAAIQKTQAGLAGEISALRATIQELRDQLQALREAGQADAQSVRAKAAAEIKQLEATINAMRGQLEVEGERRRSEVAELQAAFAKEREMLHQQIKALRAKLQGGS
jgi:chemotaxis protein MotB